MINNLASSGTELISVLKNITGTTLIFIFISNYTYSFITFSTGELRGVRAEMSKITERLERVEETGLVQRNIHGMCTTIMKKVMYLLMLMLMLPNICY